MDKELERFIVEEADIEDINVLFKSKKLTSFELVLMYLKRIADYDKDGPGINSILEINPDALHIAEAMDSEMTSGKFRGPLHGIPVLIKDNISTKDKMHTSAGSLALADSYAPYDAHIVRRLREAGAVILGKTNMTEFANFMTENMPTGYSSRGGQVLNPYGPGKFIPGGSSSGSGASAACSFCTGAVGTETCGSILSPSCQNSVVGIKPTVGLLSRTGIIPIAHSQDTAGPMTRNVKDAAILLGCLAGIDEDDPVTYSSTGRLCSDYTGFLDAEGLKGARIGVPRYYFDQLSEDEKGIIEKSLEIMKIKGAQIIDPVIIKSAGRFEEYNVLLYEFKAGLNAYLHSLGQDAPMHSLKEIIDFNNKNPEKMLKYGQTILVESENTSGTLTESLYIRERTEDIYLSRNEGIDGCLKEYNLDAILLVGNWGADITARAGYPSVIVPAGYTCEGEPVGITFTAEAYSEAKLIKFSYSFEQASKKRIAPKLG